MKTILFDIPWSQSRLETHVVMYEIHPSAVSSSAPSLAIHKMLRLITAVYAFHREEDIQKMLSAQVHIGTRNSDSQMQDYIWRRRQVRSSPSPFISVSRHLKLKSLSWPLSSPYINQVCEIKVLRYLRRLYQGGVVVADRPLPLLGSTCLFCRDTITLLTHSIQDGIHILNIGKTWEKLVLAARIIVAIENPQVNT